MKTGLRMLVVGLFLATFSSGFGAVKNSDPMPLAPQPKLESSQVIVSQKTTFSASELAKYKQREQAAKEKTRQQAAGAAMDTTTMVIIGVLVVVVVVAVASGGGGSSGY